MLPRASMGNNKSKCIFAFIQTLTTPITWLICLFIKRCPSFMKATYPSLTRAMISMVYAGMESKYVQESDT